MSDQPGTARIGVREVAALAGVSTQTVSRVLNDSPNLREETRRRVLDAMESLGYRVNNAARALGTRRTRVLGVIATDASLYGPTIGIAAIESAARAQGRWIATVYADASDDASVAAAVDHLLSQGVDGVLLVAPHVRTLQVVSSRVAGMPVAALHAGVGATRQRAGAEAVVAHLVGLGHRRIARLAGPAEWLEEVERAVGFARALDRHGLSAAGSWRGDWSAASGYAVAADLVHALEGPDAPTAIAVANDQMALGLIAGLRAAGIAVPERLSVTGFDDNPDASYYLPSLTTVRVDLSGEARRAVGDVLGRPAPDPAPPTLLVRDSTAAPA